MRAFGTLTVGAVAIIATGALVITSACSDDTIDTDTTTTTTTADGGTGGDGGNGTGGTPDPSTCAEYCADVTANCGDADVANAQWGTAVPTDTCENFCTIWDDGTPGDMTGDTLECRAYHSGAAASDAATHCGHAGPYGNQVCGVDQCTTFCAAAVLLCTGTEQIYASEDLCTADCDNYADADTPFVADSSDVTDSFACRGYHLTAAADDPVVHCQHAGGPTSDLGDSAVCDQ